MKQIKNKKIIIGILISLFIIITSSVSVYAIEYVPLEPKAFEGITLPKSGTNLGSFLGQVFNFGIAIAVALSLVMIIWGGIIKMTTDSWSKTDEANKKIKNAVYGLILALISYLLLYTINPDMVKFTNNSLLGTSNTQSK